MQEVINFSLAGLCIWANYHRAKSKNASVTTGVLLGLFLNILGVGIFYFRTRTTKPPKQRMNTITSK
jgi:hypothetical protein